MKKFKLPPVSPLLGSSLLNYIRVTHKKSIHPRFRIKFLLTGLIIFILSPFRWYEKWRFRAVNQTPINNPVFILGHWRSGTTHLHNLLCQSPKAAYVSTYQTVFTQYLGTQKLLEPILNLLIPKKRPSDNVKLNVAYPQEEEFALCNSTIASYYHFFYFPKSSARYFDRFVSFNTGEKSEWSQAYDNLLKKAKFTMPNTDYLVIKNPVNTGRYTALKDLYPDAKFIHIYRNPYIVFLSTKKFFIELMPTIWFEPINEIEIENLILDRYLDFLGALYAPEVDRNSVVDLKFEYFEKNQLSSIEKLYQELNMKGYKDAKPFFESYIQQQKMYVKNEYIITRRELNLITTKWGKYIKKWEYDIPANLKVID